MSHRDTDASRLDVRSADGTPLAVWVKGEGPPIVLFHGSLCDHTRFDALVAELRPDMTSFAMDRRGFGRSGDADGYSIEREFEDVAAVVDAVAARTGGPVALWGHSYGANCAMGGAALTDQPGAPSGALRTEPGTQLPPRLDRGCGAGIDDGRSGSGHPAHARRGPGDDRGRRPRHAREPDVAGPPRRRTHGAEGVQG